MKTCFKCKETKPLNDFYKHPKMSDGRVNKCKECNKKDVRDNRNAKVDYYRKYDRDRGARQSNEYQLEYRSKYPGKYAAHISVRNAVRDGLLIPLSCEVCGEREKIHAHHDDYSRQLDVRWLCAAHHKQWHEEHGEGKNGR